ncbi:MAG: hypothetical protein WA061_02245 [Microgenomates group bacterium]
MTEPNKIPILVTLQGETFTVLSSSLGTLVVSENFTPFVQQASNWNSTTNPTQILNKPTIPTVEPSTVLNDVLVGDGTGGWVKKTLAEFKTILGI